MTHITLSPSANITIFFPDGRRLTVPTSECTFEIKRDWLDITPFGDTSKQYVRGMSEIRANYRGEWGEVIGEFDTLDVPFHDLDPIQQMGLIDEYE